MNVELIGPFNFDMQSPLQSAQHMLATFAAVVRQENTRDWPEEPADDDTPGAYLILHEGRLAGFWVIFSARYLDDGTRSSAVPPYANVFLDAATEEIWWARLPVTPMVGGAWRPLIVLEWRHDVAALTTFPPPGIKPEQIDQEEEDEHGSWLEPIEQHAQWEPEREPTAKLEWLGLTPERSVICVIRGEMRKITSRHEGRFELFLPSLPDKRHTQGEPLEEWLVRMSEDMSATLPEHHAFGHPIQLPGRAAFPVSGWINRDLELVPDDPQDAVAGVLASRDIRSRLWSQLALAVLITFGVLAIVTALSGGLYLASIPPESDAAPVVESQAQPALSVCSEDHTGFVDEFRCQINRLSKGQPLATDQCVKADTDRGEEDLTAQYCGLRARDVDGFLYGNKDSFANMAAAQACFNVLGRPYSHTQDGVHAIPDEFLEDAENRLPPLRKLVERLDKACDVYENWQRGRMGGAVLSAHVGGDAQEAKDLQNLVFRKAKEGMDVDRATCFEMGRAENVGTAPSYESFCGTGITLARALRNESPSERKSITTTVLEVLKLGGPVPAAHPVMERYLDARYLERERQDPLISCHSNLSRGRARANVRGKQGWGISVSGPARYGGTTVSSQLVLDAVLLGLRYDKHDGGDCWKVVDRQLASYEPIHPLLQETLPGSWPSQGQQLCVQACAVHYRAGHTGKTADWMTPTTDIQQCVWTGPPSSNSSNTDLTQLRMPWHRANPSANPDGAPRWKDWVPPSPLQVCAFNLVASAYIPNVLHNELEPPFWAGKTGKGIQGGSDGAAFVAAEALSTYGRSRSRANCAHVAAECFAEELLLVLDDRTRKPYEWSRAWRERVNRIPDWPQEDLNLRPWCRLIWPYLRVDGTLPQGEFDFPCALGIEESASRFEKTIERLVLTAEGMEIR